MSLAVFDLPAHLAHKADPALIADDERRFAVIAARLEQTVAELTDQLAARRVAAAGHVQQALERDLEIHRLSARLRLLRRFRLDLCLGRIVPQGGGDPVHVGRIGLVDADGKALLVDWRAPAAEPYFAATRADPMGVASRRRYRWRGGRVHDYWDEVFDRSAGPAALDDESAFIASLGERRTPRMRDVLGTIQADQHAIIRAGARGALVVDGGPGTGKTVVALHRAAALLYSDPRIARGDGVLLIGPHDAYLSYVDDVLPNLGEDGVLTCTLLDLVAEGATAVREAAPEVARLKASGSLVAAVGRAVRSFEAPPTETLRIETDWVELEVGPDDWAEAFEAADPGLSHNDARDQVWAELLDLLTARTEEDLPSSVVRAALAADEDLGRAFARAWPLLDPAGVVADLWTVPRFLRRCAPGLTDAEVVALQRADPRAWTTADLPLLDAARRRIGDPGAARDRRRREAAAASRQEQVDRVVDELIAADDGEGLVTMLRGADVQHSLADDEAAPRTDPEVLAGPFAHVVVDEAQELTDAEWAMVLRRCPSRSVTVVGDRAQARHGFPESWEQRLRRVGFREVRVASLRVNYRTPAEVMAVAEPVIRAALPDANVPVSVRSGGLPVRTVPALDPDTVVDEWLAAHQEGVACVIGDPTFRARPRVRSLMPDEVKGLEFDLVVLADAAAFGGGVTGAVDRYVAMTRTTGELVLLRA